MLHPVEHKANKVLMIARAFPPFLPVGHSIRVIKFIKYLPALKWNPIVLTVDQKNEYETLPKVGSETLLSEVRHNLKIYRTRVGEPSLEYLQKEDEFRKKNWLTEKIIKNFRRIRNWIFWNLLLPDRAVTWLPFAVTRGCQVVKREDIAVIFATCPPHSATLIGAFIKLFTGKPLILDFRDDWIDTPWHNSKPAISRRIDRALEKWVVKIADKIILVTEWSKEAFQNRYPSQPKDKFTFVPNGCDLKDFDALKEKETAPPSPKFTVVHAGSLNISTVWGRSLTGLFQAIQNILKESSKLRANINFVFAGDLPEEFQELAKQMGLADVIQGVGHLPHNEVLHLIKSANLLLAINYEGWDTIIPGKIYEYWAVGNPPILLLSCLGAAANFIERHHLGFTATPDDVDDIHQKILAVYNQWKNGSPLTISSNGIEEFDRQVLTGQLAQILTTLSSL